MPWIRNGFEVRSSARRACSIAALLTKQVALRIGYGLLCTLALFAWLLANLYLAIALDRLVSWYVPFVEEYVFLPAFLVLVAIWAAALIFFRTKTRRRRDEAEVTRWLAERSGSPPTSDYTRWLRRAKRWSLWGPPALALVVLLFFPETAGIASHLFRPGAGKLGQYRVQTPITWVIADRGDSNNFSYVALYGAKGIARAGRIHSPVSFVTFHRSIHDSQLGLRKPDDVKITSTRTFQVGRELVTCWEYTLDYILWEYNVEAVACSSSGGEFGASFFGQKTDIPNFYKVVQSVRRTD